MTRLEIAKILNGIMTENRFSIIDRDNCHNEHEQKINSMQNIFELKEKSDFTYLYAVAELLSDVPDAVKRFLINENEDSAFAKDATNPSREDKLLMATALEENIEFFSMAWNWVSIVEAEIGEKSVSNRNNSVMPVPNIANKNFSWYREINEEVYVSAAGSPGLKNITHLEIDNIGNIEIQGNEEDQLLTFVVFLKHGMEKNKFELSIEFEINGENKIAIIRKDWDDDEHTVATDPVHVDFSKGFKIKSIFGKLL